MRRLRPILSELLQKILGGGSLFTPPSFSCDRVNSEMPLLNNFRAYREKVKKKTSENNYLLITSKHEIFISVKYFNRIENAFLTITKIEGQQHFGTRLVYFPNILLVFYCLHILTLWLRDSNIYLYNIHFNYYLIYFQFFL